MMVIRPSAGLAIAWTMTALAGAFVVGANPQPAPARAIWHGIQTVTQTDPRCEATNREEFVWVEETDANSVSHWVSRESSWDNSGSCRIGSNIAIVDGRRTEASWSINCTARGQVDMNNWDGVSIQPRCEESPPGLTMFGKIAPAVYSGPPSFSPVDRSELRDGCTYNRRWVEYPCCVAGTRRVTTQSITLSMSGPVTAVMAADPKGEYGGFVPEPGKTLTFTANVASGAARFRFELDPEATSHFPGYATNAYVDDVFFVKYNLGHLRGRYANDGPDMIFDQKHFGGQEWSRVEPLVVETRAAQSAAIVTVTAMDYGAVGRLRAFVKSEDCGDWTPVSVRVGTKTREAISIPMDEDNNLMADALEMYRGMDSGADVDAEPKGNGMVGDGLTAFEEYRGFMTRGANCGEPSQTFESYGTYAEGEEAPFPGWSDEHIRSAPDHKDLFVHTPDPELVALLDNFAWASGLSVHSICEPHYVDNDTRIVNFTLQQNGARTWMGRTLSQAAPQHGILVKPVAETEFASLGTAVAVVAGTSGPPKFTAFVEIRKSAPIQGVSLGIRRRLEARQRDAGTRADLSFVVVHELAHAVGLPHHGDNIHEWRDVPGRMNVVPGLSPRQRAGGPIDLSSDLSPTDIPDLLLVEPGPECRKTDDTAAYMTGQFVGCLAGGIARRGQQNSGEMDCPMRYPFQDWYEPPSSTALYLNPGFVTRTAVPTASDVLIKIDAWGGRLRRYQNDLDRIPRGRLCASIRGTGINALGGDRNHAGNAGRDRPCIEFLVVNDLAAPGVP